MRGGGQHRSTQRRPTAPADAAEARLREHLRDFARCHPSLGGRKAYAVAHREGLVTNAERTRRVWRDECLQRPPAVQGQAPPVHRRHRRSAARCGPNDVWPLEFCFDETVNLRRIKLLNIVDEFTRGPLRRSRPQHQRPPRRRRQAPRHPARCPTSLARGQRPRVRLRGAARLVPHLGHPHSLHRDRLTLGEPPTPSPPTNASETNASTQKSSRTSSKPKSCSRLENRI